MGLAGELWKTLGRAKHLGAMKRTGDNWFEQNPTKQVEEGRVSGVLLSSLTVKTLFDYGLETLSSFTSVVRGGVILNPPL